MFTLWYNLVGPVGVIYYELLNPNQIVIVEIDAIQPSAARKTATIRAEAQWCYNARPEVAETVKSYLKVLLWEVLLVLQYSSDIALSDHYLIHSVAYGLANQQFHSYENMKK